MRVAMRGDDRVAGSPGRAVPSATPGPHASVRPFAPASTSCSTAGAARAASRPAACRPTATAAARSPRGCARFHETSSSAWPTCAFARIATAAAIAHDGGGRERERQRDAPARDSPPTGKTRPRGSGRVPAAPRARRACVARSAAERSSPSGVSTTRRAMSRATHERGDRRVAAPRARRASHASASSTKPTTSSTAPASPSAAASRRSPTRSRPAGSSPGTTRALGIGAGRRDRRHVDRDEARVLADEVMLERGRDDRGRTSSAGAPATIASESAAMRSRAHSAPMPFDGVARAGRQQRAPRGLAAPADDRQRLRLAGERRGHDDRLAGVEVGQLARLHLGADRPGRARCR